MRMKLRNKRMDGPATYRQRGVSTGKLTRNMQMRPPSSFKDFLIFLNHRTTTSVLISGIFPRRTALSIFLKKLFKDHTRV